MSKASEAAAFYEANVDRSGGPNACHPWRGARIKRPGADYGRLTVDGRSVLAHRFGWALANGPIPDGLHVCHHCDNPPCQNPAHLFLGTDQDNCDDKIAKGRLRAAPGERHRNAKITDDQARDIRQRWRRGHRYRPGNTAALAAEYGLTEASIRKVATGFTWKHLH